MSGGSYEYAYEAVERFADALERGSTFEDRATEAGNSDPARLGFAAHLRKVAAAMKAIEWVDSYDSSPPADEDAIRTAIDRPDTAALQFAYSTLQAVMLRSGMVIRALRDGKPVDVAAEQKLIGKTGLAGLHVIRDALKKG